MCLCTNTCARDLLINPKKCTQCYEINEKEEHDDDIKYFFHALKVEKKGIIDIHRMQTKVEGIKIFLARCKMMHNTL